MRKILPFLLIMGIAACNLLVFTPQQAFEQLREVRTPEEEAAVFRYIWRNVNELSFRAYDDGGEVLPVSRPDFPARLYAIDLQVNGETYHHVLIDPENIDILMRE